MENRAKKRRSGMVRALTLVGALIALMSVCMLPVSAEEISGPTTVDLNDTTGTTQVWETYLAGGDWTETGVPSAAYYVTLDVSDLGVRWNGLYSYVSFQFWTAGQSHITIGFWTETIGGMNVICYRIGRYDENNGSPTENWQKTGTFFAASQLEGVSCAYYMLPGDSDHLYLDLSLYLSTLDAAERVTMTVDASEAFCFGVKVIDASVTAQMYHGLGASYENAVEWPEQLEQAGGNYYNGYNAGHAAGISEGFQDGYDAFRDDLQYKVEADGVPVGDDATLDELYKKILDVGWTQCADQGGVTTRLIYAILEAPINVILGGLNFDLFGINIASGVMALLSLGLVFIIIRVAAAIIALI